MDSTSGYALRSIHEGNFKLEDLCQRALWNYLEPAASGSGFLAGAVPLVKRTPPPDAYESIMELMKLAAETRVAAGESMESLRAREIGE